MLEVCCGEAKTPRKPLYRGDIVECTEQCPFCEELQRTREINEYLVKDSNRPGKTHIEYRVALVQNTSYNGYSCGGSTSQSFPLNCCPVCGRKIGNIDLMVEGDKCSCD